MFCMYVNYDPNSVFYSCGPQQTQLSCTMSSLENFKLNAGPSSTTAVVSIRRCRFL